MAEEIADQGIKPTPPEPRPPAYEPPLRHGVQARPIETRRSFLKKALAFIGVGAASAALGAEGLNQYQNNNSTQKGPDNPNGKITPPSPASTSGSTKP